MSLALVERVWTSSSSGGPTGAPSLDTCFSFVCEHTRHKLTITHVPVGWVPTETADVTLGDLEDSQLGDPQTSQQGVFQQTGLFSHTDRTTGEDQRVRVGFRSHICSAFHRGPCVSGVVGKSSSDGWWTSKCQAQCREEALARACPPPPCFTHPDPRAVLWDWTMVKIRKGRTHISSG